MHSYNIHGIDENVKSDYCSGHLLFQPC